MNYTPLFLLTILLFCAINSPLNAQIIVTQATIPNNVADFGIQAPNTVKGKILKIENIGSVTYTITNVTLSGSNDFSMGTSFTWPTTITPGQQYNVNVYFGSYNPGTHAGQIEIQHNANYCESTFIYMEGIAEGTSCPTAGTACDDGDATTFFDEENGYCECNGDPCAILGDPCDDGDANTYNDVYNEFCTCAGTPCPSSGTACNDGDPNTYNDTFDGGCNCAGTPCPSAGTACNDGLYYTNNDVFDSNCNCAGVVDCPIVQLPLDSARAGLSYLDNDAPYSIDNNLGTSWYNNHQPTNWIEFVLDQAEAIEYFRIRFYDSDVQTYSFDIRVDGAIVYSGISALNSNYQTFIIPITVGTNVRVESFCYNSAATSFFGVAEMEIYGVVCCPAQGTPCNDGNSDTTNDVEDGNCNCYGDCPYLGWGCDDGDPNTNNDLVNIFCDCVGNNCPQAGTSCNDGDPTTGNDVYDANCGCAGTPCPASGTACDDNDASTFNDIEDGTCNCVGTPCPASGTSCNDGDPCTTNDQEDGNCNCVGTLIDADNDGVCDSNDVCPSGDDNLDMNNNNLPDECEPEYGTCDNNGGDFDFDNICDDHDGCLITEITNSIVNVYDSGQDAGTYIIWNYNRRIRVLNNAWKALEVNYTITANTVLEFDFKSTDEGEIHEITFDNDLSLGSPDGDNARFKLYGTQNVNLNTTYQYSGSGNWESFSIPVGNYNSPGFFQYLGITSDDDANDGGNSYFRNIMIYEDADGNGQCDEPCSSVGTACDDGNASTFNDAYDVTCTCIGNNCPVAGTACDDGNPNTYFDEEDGQCNCAGIICGNAGDPCDDGDPSTYNDVEDGSCGCAGIPCPSAGTACNDNDASTYNDVEDGNCNCVGTPCPAAGTSCNDGDPTTGPDVEDGNCNCAGPPCPSAGTACNDNDASTFNDIEDGNCNCVGTPCPTAGTSCNDNDASTFNDIEDGNCNCVGTPCPAAGTSCNDGDPTTGPDVEDGNCNCAGPPCPSAGTACNDNDASTFNDIEDGNCNCVGTPCPTAGTACNDGDPTTSPDVEDGFCNCVGTPCPSAGTACNDNDASTFNDIEDGNCNCVGTPCPVAGTACNDNDASTFNDIEDGNCNCVGTPCPTAGTACNDGDPNTVNDAEDGFCNCAGVICAMAGTPCNDNDASTFNDVEDGLCNCVGTPCPAAGTACDDGDLSTVNDVEDGFCNCAGTNCPSAGTACNDNDASTFNDVEDGFCNCVGTPCPSTGTACDDGDPCTINDMEDGNCNCAGTYSDSDGDGVCDANDICPNGDDTVDVNNDGLPDDCDPNFNICGSVGGDFDNDGIWDNYDSCLIMEITNSMVNVYDPSQDAGTYQLQDNGATIFMENNAWKALEVNYSVTANTVIEFDFKSTDEGEIHHIGFDDDLELAAPGGNNNAMYQVYGFQSTFFNTTYQYSGSGNWEHFVIPIGSVTAAGFYQYLGVTCDDDTNNAGNSYYSNILIYEDTNGNGQCDDPCLSVGTPCDDGDATTFNDAFDINCTCVGGPCLAAGTPCDDGDSCTQNDMFDSSCNCAGTMQDADNDGVCDMADVCPGGDDNLDMNNNGQPDECEPNYGVCDNDGGDFDFDSICDDYDSCLVEEITSSGIFVYAPNNDNGQAYVQDNGTTIMLENNAWKAIEVNYNITSNTVLEFYFASTDEGEIHEIVLDDDLSSGTPDGNNARFKLYGTQNVSFNTNYQYNGSGNWQYFTIPIGNIYTSGFYQYLGMSCDDDATGTGNSYFSNILIYEDANNDGICDEPCSSVGTPCDDGDPTTVNDEYGTDCVCAGDPCPTTGNACDDGDPCTVNDAIDVNCNCVGTFSDIDGDMVCDANDVCPGGNDNLDMNNNGQPDYCEPTYGQCDTVGGDFDFDNICDDYDSCLIRDITASNVQTYGGSQDQGQYSIEDNGTTILVENNAWKSIDVDYTITPNTVIEFDFKTTEEGEDHEFFFDDNQTLNTPDGDAGRIMLYGTQNTNFNQDYDYVNFGNWQHFNIPIGSIITAGFYDYLVFVADDDANGGGNSYFSNVLIYEDPDGNGQCDDPCASVGTGCNDGDPATINDAIDIHCNCVGQGPTLTSTKVTVNLEGFYDFGTNDMGTDLKDLGLVPLTQPFNEAPYFYAGNENVTSHTANTVDWVLVMAHDANGNVISQKACLLHNNSKVVTTAGNETIGWYLYEPYYISVHHKSHLAVINNFLIDDVDVTVDFRLPNVTQGNQQVKVVNGENLLYCGDFDRNGIVNNLDYNMWVLESAVVFEYVKWDGDGNGIVNNLDYNLWNSNKSKVGVNYIQF